MTNTQLNAYVDTDLDAAWEKMLKLFNYEYATVAEEYLCDSHSQLRLGSGSLIQMLAWARSMNLLEPADEIGRFRLTSKGRQSWRNSSDLP